MACISEIRSTAAAAAAEKGKSGWRDVIIVEKRDAEALGGENDER